MVSMMRFSSKSPPPRPRRGHRDRARGSRGRGGRGRADRDRRGGARPAAVLPGARPDQALERLQSFEDLALIVVLHWNPPYLRPTLANARYASIFTRTGRHRRTCNCDRQRAALCAR